MFKLLSFIGGLCLLANHVHGQSDTLNQKDEKARKQGYWIVYGKYKPEKGFCDSCKIAEGIYVDSRKHGSWIKYYHSGDKRFDANYKYGRPYRCYTKYNQNGWSIQEREIIHWEYLPLQ